VLFSRAQGTIACCSYVWGEICDLLNQLKFAAWEITEEKIFVLRVFPLSNSCRGRT